AGTVAHRGAAVRDLGRAEGSCSDLPRRVRDPRRRGRGAAHLRHRLRRRAAVGRDSRIDDPTRCVVDSRSDARCPSRTAGARRSRARGMIGALPPSSPALVSISVTNGSTPFAGDGRLLTTVSPIGDGFRDRAIVHFRLTAAARVRMDAVRTDTIRTGRNAAQVVWSTKKELGAGPQLLVWKPARSTPPRTYILRLTVTDAHGGKRVYSNPGPSGPVK